MMTLESIRDVIDRHTHCVDDAILTRAAAEILAMHEQDDFWRKRYWEKCNEIVGIKEKVAPLLGLKPFPTDTNTQQIIWARSKEEADSVRLGESVLKIVDQILEGEKP